MSDQPTPQDVHIDTFGGGAKKRRRKEKPMDEATVYKVYKREFGSDERQKLATEGKALSDGSYPIEAAVDLGPAATLARSKHGDYRAAEALIHRRAKELGATDPLSKADTEIIVALWKSEHQQIAYGVALEPNLEDSQGDVATPEEIEKAAHRYLMDFRKTDVQHDGEQAAAVPVESYIAPHDMLLAGELVKKGSWVLAHKISDAGLWDRIMKGELTGLSIEGTAVRIPMPEVAE